MKFNNRQQCNDIIILIYKNILINKELRSKICLKKIFLYHYFKDL